MKKLSILLLIICSFQAIGQTISPENRIVVIGMAEVEIPADRVVFRVKITCKSDDNIKKAFDAHKQAESKLVLLLKDLKIPDKNISYTLLNMGKNERYDKSTESSKNVYFTYQVVKITLDSIKNYTDFMLKLVSGGFDEINTDFISSKENEFHDILITKALERATQKAQVMANSSNRKLGKCIKVADTEETDPNFSYQGWGNGFEVSYDFVGNNRRGRGDYSGETMTVFEQTVKKSMSVKVVFELK
jgi:uncharacterized protein